MKLMSRVVTWLSGMSWRRTRERAPLRGSQGSARVACSSLVVSIAMSTSGCLITSTPQFDEPQQTRPFLLGQSAIPSLSKTVVIDKQSSSIVEFSADVVSQDAPNDEVRCLLLLDYGFPNSGLPYRFVIYAADVPPGSLNQTAPRRCKVLLNVLGLPLETGCHNATLLVTHALKQETQCPEKEDDYSLITWQVFFCDSSQDPDACDNVDLTPCKSWDASCFSSSLDAGGGS